ncbi:MAG: type II methionyl aminopeptidase [DPANN group archaeon]|nr:type II methionyl aminopeptidase [DPANN group archaeon]
MLSKDIEDKYILAGKIAAYARDKGKTLIVPGALAFDIVEAVEAMIIDKGGLFACPTTLSINNIAAHYTPEYGDKTIIGENDVVKLDMGVHVDGFIADTATTVCLDKDKEPMNECVKKALDEAIKAITPGVNVGYLGEIIQSVIFDAGFKPVSNLTGHVLEQYELHTGIGVPNIKMKSSKTLEDGMVVAIEPFATDGSGFVKESGHAQIFMFEVDKSIRLDAARKIMTLSKTKFNKMPFASRWIKGVSPQMINLALKQLTAIKAMASYPTLQEAKGVTVTHAEHTIIVKDKPIVTTKI